MSDASEATLDLVDDARIHLGSIRSAWPLLGDARNPGSSTPPPTGPDKASARAQRLTAWRADREAATEARRHGRVPSGHHPMPLRAAPVEARTRISTQLRELASRMWGNAHTGGLVLVIRDQVSRGLLMPCQWCHGIGLVEPPTGWGQMWPGPQIACERCRGTGQLPVACQSCDATGPCPCDRADVVVAVSLPVITALLDRGDISIDAAADAEQTLLDLAELANRTLGLGPQQRRLAGAECPVCGARELYADTTSPRRQEWWITCNGPYCRCEGTGCPCRRGTPRRAGRRHKWPARSWNQLSELLDTPLPAIEPNDTSGGVS